MLGEAILAGTVNSGSVPGRTLITPTSDESGVSSARFSVWPADGCPMTPLSTKGASAIASPPKAPR